MRTPLPRPVLAVPALVLALAAPALSPALAQTRPAPAPAPAAPVPSAPDAQRTTATYGDWTLRCERPDTAAQSCEVGETLFADSQPVAQIAIGRATKSEPLRLTVLVPVNVSLLSQPRLAGAAGERDAPAVELAWRRCVPQGCFADAPLRDDLLRRLRLRTEPSRLLFQDAGLREAALPFSPRGLPQALDALLKEER